MDIKDLFIREYNESIRRCGANELLEYIKSTSFFEDPASAAYHLNVPCGLCLHSLNVHHRLKILATEFPEISEESVAIVSLLHDLCKAGTYVSSVKNQKTYDPEKIAQAPRYSVKHDSMGDFIWESVQGYRNNDTFPYGHGEKSVFLIQKYMTLTDEEAMAIRYHMGSWNDGEKNGASAAFEAYPLAFLLHVADEWATFVTEKG